MLLELPRDCYFYLKKIIQFCLHVVGVYAHVVFVNIEYVVNELEIVLYEGILSFVHSFVSYSLNKYFREYHLPGIVLGT